MNVLLTSAGRRGYLVKYFKEAIGAEGTVHVSNSSPIAPAFYYADHHVVTPLIYDKEYIPFLMKYCTENNISAIISLFDIDLYILAIHKKDFAEIGVKVIVSDPNVIEICNDKWNTYNFCINNGFLSPKTFISLSDALCALKCKEMTYPVMVKPRWGMGSIGVFKADNEDELKVFYQKTKNAISSTYLKYESAQNLEQAVLIQECLEGQEYGLDVINDLSTNYVTTIVRMKYAMRSGETDCALVLDDSAMKELGMKISTTLRHIANLDADIFMVEGKPYILEMNARFGGGYPFSHMAGANLPKAIVEWLNGNTLSENLLKVKSGVLAQKDITMIDISDFVEE